MLAAAAEDSLYESYVVLQYRNKALQRELDSFRNGTRYKKLQEDHRRVIAGYIRENKNLRQELAMLTPRLSVFEIFGLRNVILSGKSPGRNWRKRKKRFCGLRTEIGSC